MLVLCQCSFDGCRSPRFILEKVQTKVWTPTGTRQNKVDRVLGANRCVRPDALNVKLFILSNYRLSDKSLHKGLTRLPLQYVTEIDEQRASKCVRPYCEMIFLNLYKYSLLSIFCRCFGCIIIILLWL